MVLASFFGGTLVDRIGYRRASSLGDLLSGIAVALITTLHHTVGIAFWQLLVIALLAEIACTMPIVALRELAGIDVPTAVGGGLGGAAMWLIVRWFAQRRLAAQT